MEGSLLFGFELVIWQRLNSLHLSFILISETDVLTFAMKEGIEFIERLICGDIVSFTEDGIADVGDLLNELVLFFRERTLSELKVLDSITINVL